MSRTGEIRAWFERHGGEHRLSDVLQGMRARGREKTLVAAHGVRPGSRRRPDGDREEGEAALFAEPRARLRTEPSQAHPTVAGREPRLALRRRHLRWDACPGPRREGEVCPKPKQHGWHRPTPGNWPRHPHEVPQGPQRLLPPNRGQRMIRRRKKPNPQGVNHEH